MKNFHARCWLAVILGILFFPLVVIFALAKQYK